MAFGPVRVTPALELDKDGIGSITIGGVGETTAKIAGRDGTDNTVEVFLVRTSGLVCPLTVDALMVQICIGLIQGQTTAYKEDLYEHHGQDRDRNKVF